MRQPSGRSSTTDDGRSDEHTVYRLSIATDLRCSNNQDESGLSCGHCETCVFGQIMQNTKQWFPRASDNSKLKFVVGLTQRFDSYDLLEYVLGLLKPATEYKDFIYARSRTQPSLPSDHTAMCGDRALTPDTLSRQMGDTWLWFESGRYWTKANYMLALMRLCSMKLLNLLANQLHTVRTRHRKAAFSGKSANKSGCSTHTDRSISESFNIPLSTSTQSAHNYSEIESMILTDDGGGSSVCSFDPTCPVIATSPRAQYGIARHKDFIRCLPVHLSKFILNFVDKPTLYNALCVSAAWRLLVEEVLQEVTLHRALQEEVAVMQGASAKGCSPVYAKDVTLPVPKLLEGGLEVERAGEYQPPPQDLSLSSDTNISTAYRGVVTRPVYMVEKNIYCGPYNTMILSHHEDPYRVVHYCSGQFVAIGSYDRKVRLIYIQDGREKDVSIHGHAGSIHCCYINEQHGCVVSGSYDTSIRCWSLETGQCLKILRGHVDTVTCLSMFDDIIVSGCKDTTVKVWNFSTGKAVRTFRHKHTVNTVQVNEDTVVSGCDGGFVKVWSIKNAALVKTLEGHQRAVHCVTFDKWHIVSGGGDGYVLVWSLFGSFKRCLAAFRHPRPVLCISMAYLRVVTGCEDGKIRVWNVLTGECLRLLRGNSRSDPIQNMLCSEQRMVINTLNNMLVLNFEQVDWDYTLDNDKVAILKHSNQYSAAPFRHVAYPHIRAFRMLKTNASDTRLLQTPQSRGEQRLVTARVLPHSAKTLNRNSARSNNSRVSATTTVHTNTDTLLTNRDTFITENRSPATARISSAPVCKLSTAHDRLSLSEVKALMRSQLRQREAPTHHSDNVYLTLATMDNMKKRNGTDVNTCCNAGMSVSEHVTMKRPSSSPPKCDPRDRTQLSDFSVFQQRQREIQSGVEKINTGYELPTSRTIVTELVERPVSSKSYQSMFAESTPSTIPKPRLVRPDLSSHIRARRPPRPQSVGPPTIRTTATHPIRDTAFRMTISQNPLTNNHRKNVPQLTNPFISHSQLGLLTHAQQKRLLEQRYLPK